MVLSKVKMVVTDMDGTLLNSDSEVSNNFLHLYSELKKHKLRFVAASGRPYSSITNKLNTIKDEITIVAENGAYVKHGNKELLLTNLPNIRTEQILLQLRNIKGAFTVLCGKKSAYIESNDKRFIDMFVEYYAKYKIVNDLTRVNNDTFFKIAVYHFDCSELHIYPAVKHLKSEMQVKVSGANWLDLSDPYANKGHAINFLQERWGISKNETMVFGDYNNDLEMMDQGFFSYAMENAHSNIKKAARFKTKSNNEEGVEFILEKLLKAKESSLNKK